LAPSRRSKVIIPLSSPTEWGRVTVTWWTHKIRGLHRNDFIMAAKTDALAAEIGSVTRGEVAGER